MIRGLKFYFLRGKEGLASDASDYNMAPSFFFYRNYTINLTIVKVKLLIHQKLARSHEQRRVYY